jgi:hypothetical protein
LIVDSFIETNGTTETLNTTSSLNIHLIVDQWIFLALRLLFVETYLLTNNPTPIRASLMARTSMDPTILGV